MEFEQILVPHLHVDGFTKAPEFCVHAAPSQQAQMRSVEHGPVLAAGINWSCLSMPNESAFPGLK